MISRARSSNFCLGRGPCAHLTLTFSGSILVLHCLAEPFGWPSAGCLEVHKCTVFCRNIKRNIKRYWISRRICRSICCYVAKQGGIPHAVSTRRLAHRLSARWVCGGPGSARSPHLIAVEREAGPDYPSS